MAHSFVSFAVNNNPDRKIQFYDTILIKFLEIKIDDKSGTLSIQYHIIVGLWFE